MLAIGDLARRTGVKVPTIRYYEQMGLIDAAERSEGNQRRYGRSEEDRLSFIKHARQFGLSVETIRELLRLSAGPEGSCGDAGRIAAEQLAVVRQRIAELRRLERELARISAHCHGDQVKDCYVIQAFANHELCDDEH
ncbi:helix-turn-helix domain-containing protein [Mesorhizobium sp. B2-6-2]|uniref:MerR family transcriptional regulator n=1 Tax=Mesorhizobium sp. B2-6-2 TaxID=2589915 RepID=UPI00112E2575|nr:helix-turn-helix domain-containing protein [Mesorhizobium sp. B2-6-2]TPJ77144.1 helix-turn-helix domain-containing protein [Mesorhizobium sp. B2-6-2]